MFLPLKPKLEMTEGVPILKPLEQCVWVPGLILPVRALDRREPGKSETTLTIRPRAERCARSHDE